MIVNAKSSRSSTERTDFCLVATKIFYYIQVNK
jgi:hypothetical protein